MINSETMSILVIGLLFLVVCFVPSIMDMQISPFLTNQFHIRRIETKSETS